MSLLQDNLILKPTRNSGGLPWYFYALFIGLGLLFTAIGIGWTVKTRQFVASAVHVKGTLVEYAQHEDSDSGSTMYAPVVEFTTQDGQPIRFTSSTSSSMRSWDVGQQINMLYDPQKPEHAEIASIFDLWFGPAIFLFIGIVFTAIGIGVWIAFRRGAASGGEPPSPFDDEETQALSELENSSEDQPQEPVVSDLVDS